MPGFGDAPFRPLIVGTKTLAERLALDADGALVRGLRGQTGASRPDFQKHVALLVAAMDPCVAWDIAIREAGDA